MKKWIYVHFSNLLIQARRLSALQEGLPLPISDDTYTVDMERLWEFLTSDGHDQIGRLILCGSKPPSNRGLWRTARKLGFQVYVADRFQETWREKKVDAWMVANIFKDACGKIDRDNDRIVLVTGDSDFVPPVELLIEDGFKVDVVFWRDSSIELQMAASTFTPLDDYLEFLRYPHPQDLREKRKHGTT